MNANSRLCFNTDGKPAFEIPLSELANAAVSAKNEVTLEFSPNDTSSSAKKLDALVDIRLYIPPNNEEEGDEQSADAASVNFSYICLVSRHF
jgi:hypothetical protein